LLEALFAAQMPGPCQERTAVDARRIEDLFSIGSAGLSAAGDGAGGGLLGRGFAGPNAGLGGPQLRAGQWCPGLPFAAHGAPEEVRERFGVRGNELRPPGAWWLPAPGRDAGEAYRSVGAFHEVGPGEGSLGD